GRGDRCCGRGRRRNTTRIVSRGVSSPATRASSGRHQRLVLRRRGCCARDAGARHPRRTPREEPLVILRPGIREVTGATPEGVPTGTTRICGFDAFYGFGSLEPNTIGEHTITSLFWRDGYAQVVVAGEAPRNLFEKI